MRVCETLGEVRCDCLVCWIGGGDDERDSDAAAGCDFAVTVCICLVGDCVCERVCLLGDCVCERSLFPDCPVSRVVLYKSSKRRVCSTRRSSSRFEGLRFLFPLMVEVSTCTSFGPSVGSALTSPLSG